MVNITDGTKLKFMIWSSDESSDATPKLRTVLDMTDGDLDNHWEFSTGLPAGDTVEVRVNRANQSIVELVIWPCRVRSCEAYDMPTYEAKLHREREGNEYVFWESLPGGDVIEIRMDITKLF